MALFLLAILLFICAVAWFSVWLHRREARRNVAWLPSFEAPPPAPAPRHTRPVHPHHPQPRLFQSSSSRPQARATLQKRTGWASSSLTSGSDPSPPLDFYPQPAVQSLDEDSRPFLGGGGHFGGAGASGGWDPPSHEPAFSHSGVDTPSTPADTATPSVDSGVGDSPSVDAGTSSPSD